MQIPTNVRSAGFGGAVVVKFTCTGCGNRQLNFNSSVNITLSKRMTVSLALQVAFVIAGCAHAQYSVCSKCSNIYRYHQIVASCSGSNVE